MDVKIKCPYCGSEEVGLSEELNCEVNENGGYEHSRYGCCNKDCSEDFYVNLTVCTVKIETSKEKWENYTTIYEK